MPDLIARLCLDINVFYADLASRALRVRPSACSELVEFVLSGASPAGGVQLIISVPMIEQWQNVLERHFAFERRDAEELASILYDIASDGPAALDPLVVIGSGFVPFASEAEVMAAARRHARDAHGASESAKLFDEIEDDRHVLLTALAGLADVLATANLRDFRRYEFLDFGRDDMFVVPTAGHHLVVAKPAFVIHWLRAGITPNWDFVRERSDLFPRPKPKP
jgi:predicted small metal-binding protein